MAARDSPATVQTYEAKVAGEDGDSDVDIEAGTEPVAVNQYVLHEKLGEGAYAVVRRGEGPAPAGAPPVGAGAQAAGTTDKADVAHYVRVSARAGAWLWQAGALLCTVATCSPSRRGGGASCHA